VTDAGNKHGVVEVRVDRVATAIDQHGGDRAGVTRQDGTDPRVDSVA
jgi:hypothetical protein